MEHNFEKLSIWKRSIELVKYIYSATIPFPKEEKFGLISQMRRCSVSIPSNIAEGAGRKTEKDFSHFLNISIGSINELQTQIVISFHLVYISKEQFEYIKAELVEIKNMIYSFNKKRLGSRS